MITYLLQLTMCWALFYGAYYIILRAETHFKFSRIYLLAALVLGLVIPLVDWANYFVHEPESLGHLYIAPFNAQMEMWDITVTAKTETINWSRILTTIYLVGAFLAAGKLIGGWIRINTIRQNSIHVDHGDYTLVLTDSHHLPFSFLGSVYCSEDFYQNSRDIHQILTHEEFHVRARHSLDVIFLEILKVIFWFNPMVYLYKNELTQVHEYQADHAAYQLSSRKQYGKLLLTHMESVMTLTLANHFFNSQLKNRFKMMTKKTSTRQTVWKYIVILPTVALTIMLFSYSSQGKALIDKVMVMQDTVPPPPPPAPLAPPPPPAPPAPEVEEAKVPPRPPQAPDSIDEIVVVGYQTSRGSNAEVPPPPVPIDQNPDGNQTITGKQEVFRVVEEMPRYPGCEEAGGEVATLKNCADQKMLEFLYSNIKYPAIARQNGIEGAVVVSFVVEKDGSITNPKVVRDPGARLGEEALRIVDLMARGEKWIPGKQRGQNVAVQFILPIKFELNKNESTRIEVRSPSDNESTGTKSNPIFVLNDKILGRVNRDNFNKMIKPEDVESINVLKGETAVEKYGEIAADGVIEIYTKWKEEDDRAALAMSEVRLYPVPVDNQLNIISKVEIDGYYSLQIRDLKGQVVKRHQINTMDGILNTSMDLDGLVAGPYYLTVTHDGKVFSKVFVKQ